MIPLSLPHVTLLCASCADRELSADMLRRSLRACRFARALLFTDGEVAAPGIDVVRIPTMHSVADNSAFLLKGLADHVQTSHCLNIQWDGFVLDASAWRDDFLQWDYIGAPWPWHRDGHAVGNGGFSLRSKRLLEALRDPAIQPTANEDELICRVHRPYLESRYGIRFAPAEVAERFSFEHGVPPGPTFGFHGLFNFGRVWRDDAELADVLDRVPQRQFARNEGGWLLERLRNAGRENAAADVQRRIRPPADLESLLRQGLARHEQGDLAGAQAAYAAALELAPEHPDALHLLGVVRAAGGALDEGVALVRRAVRANPRGAGYHMNLGHLLLAAGDIPGSVASQRKALLIDPGLAGAHLGLGEALLRLGRFSEARESRERALAIDPALADA